MNTYQEGLCFSGVKLVDRGRAGRARLGPHAQQHALPADLPGRHVGSRSPRSARGEKRINELCEKYGVEVVKGSMERLIAQGELVARKRLAEMPKGTWEMDEYMDDDGHGSPVHLKVKVTITDDEFLSDFTGSDPQVAGCVNIRATAAYAGVKVIFMSIIGPELAVNDGVFAPAHRLRGGSVLQASARRRPPATTRA